MIENRRFPRFALAPMYTSVIAQHVVDAAVRTLDGHAYDISENGARLELDESVPVGTHLGLCLQLPGEASSIFATGRVIWAMDVEDDPGARRVAVEFVRFLHQEDLARLRRYLRSCPLRHAA